MIKIHKLSKSYADRLILNRLSLDIARGEFVTFFGPNGCGKSTLLKIITGIERPDSGTVFFEGTPVIGFVFQNCRESLLPWKDVRENILLPAKLRGKDLTQSEAYLDSLMRHISHPLDLKAKTYHLSGGQAQLVCLLRALIVQPEIVVLDEPFSALDCTMAMGLRTLIARLSTELDITCICITHQPDDAIYLSDRVCMFSSAPATIIDSIHITRPRPRDIEFVSQPDFLHHKLQLLEGLGLNHAPTLGTLQSAHL